MQSEQEHTVSTETWWHTSRAKKKATVNSIKSGLDINNINIINIINNMRPLGEGKQSYLW